MWFIGVEVEQETGAPPPKKNPGSAPATFVENNLTKSLLKKNIYTTGKFLQHQALI